MNKNLSEIVQIMPGYGFRTGIEVDPKGKVILLQSRSIATGEPIFDTSRFVRISSDALQNPNFLKMNDILLVSRAMDTGTFRSAIFKSKDTDVTVSSSLYVLRLKSSDALPEYVSLYLNSIEGQNALAQIVTGAHIQMIPRKELQSLKIPILPLEKQYAVINLQENIRQQAKITERKNQISRNIVNATFKKIATTITTAA